MATIDHSKYSFDDSISNFIKKFDCEVIEVTRANGYEVNDSILYIWGFNNHSEDKQICELLKQNPSVDTLYIGKNVTDKNDLEKIHCVLLSSHNIIPIIKNIIFEDNSRYYSTDGILIDRESMSIIDYASGRNNNTIAIPYGILGIKEICFNYNEYVRELILPSTIQNIDGITSLPKLENVTVEQGSDNRYISDNGIIFNSNTKDLHFIPPYNNAYPNADVLEEMFKDLLSLVRTESDNGRWNSVLPNCFSLINDESIGITYNGGFYEQYWGVRLQALPTRIVFEYSFYDIWREECALIMEEYEDTDYTNSIRRNCLECNLKNNCERILHSNRIYISNIVKKLNEANIGEIRAVNEMYVEFNIGIGTPIDQIFQTLLAFLDIALDCRTKFPIVDSPLQPSLFHESIMNGEFQYSPMEYFPFSYSYDSPKGFVLEEELEEEEPPF